MGGYILLIAKDLYDARLQREESLYSKKTILEDREIIRRQMMKWRERERERERNMSNIPY